MVPMPDTLAYSSRWRLRAHRRPPPRTKATASPREDAESQQYADAPARGMALMKIVATDIAAAAGAAMRYIRRAPAGDGDAGATAAAIAQASGGGWPRRRATSSAMSRSRLMPRASSPRRLADARRQRRRRRSRCGRPPTAAAPLLHAVEMSYGACALPVC